MAIDLVAHACFPKILPAKFTEFLVGMTKLNLSYKRLFFGTEYGRNVAVRLLEYYQHLRKVVKAIISVKFTISIVKLIISGVRNWLGIQVPMIFGMK